MSLRRRAGALVYDWPPYALRMARGRWIELHNRDEAITSDGRGVRCEWRFTSDLYLPRVFPSTGERLMRAALREWPIVERDEAATSEKPDVSFIIGHRGLTRLPLLLRTLRSIAGQSGVSIECIVVEQSVAGEIESALPPWVRYIHTPAPSPSFEYARSWAFNVGAREARAPLLILHDNDMLVPERYAAEAVARMREGWEFIDLKRFIFYLDANGASIEKIVQNLHGGSVIATRDAYFAIGGFDEGFVGWGGEDNDFRDRAEAHGQVYGFGYLPIVHLFHEPQKGKLEGDAAPAMKRYRELEGVPAAERIERLRGREIGRADVPPVAR